MIFVNFCFRINYIIIIITFLICNFFTTMDNTPERMSATHRNLNHLLKDFITEQVTLRNDDTKINKAILKEEIENKLINAMKKVNPLFGILYQNIYYTGSFYAGLRIKEADEFDLNIRLKMPFRNTEYEIVHRGAPPGFLKYKLKSSLDSILSNRPNWTIYKDITKILDSTGTFLSQPKINRWLQGIVDTAMKSSPEQFKNFRRSTNGPATTLRVTGPHGKVLDIDLVPVIELSELPETIRPGCIPASVDSKNRFAFLVPKSPVGPGTNDGTNFRVSIPEVEQDLIDNKSSLKPLIKIFKAIRDRYMWSELVSYHIKTVFLFQVEKHAQQDFWAEAHIGERFVMMLQKFIDVMNRPYLDNYFFNNSNMLASMKPVTARNIRGVLEKMLRAAEQKDLSKLKSYLERKVAEVPIPGGDAEAPIPGCDAKVPIPDSSSSSCSIQ